MKKKLLAVLLAGTMLVLTACGSTSPPSADVPVNDTTKETPTDTPADTGSTDAKDPVSFRFQWWGNDGRHERTQQIIDLYMSENSHVTIQPDFAPWAGFQEAFAVALEGGQEADLMQVNYNWLELYSPYGDTFLDLETVSQYLDLTNWAPHYLDFCRTNGVLQAVPTGITARIPFINKTVFQNAGIDTIPSTWDELKAAGRQIQEQLGNDFFALSPMGNPAGSYLVFAYLEQTTGRQFVNENNEFQYTLEELKAGFQFYQDLMDNGVVTPGGIDSDPINAENPKWIRGEYGGVVEWDSSINGWLANLEEGNEVIVSPFFSTGNDKLSGLMSRPSMGFAISRNTPHADEVARFLNFMLTDPRAVEIMGDDRGVPSNTAALAIFEGLPANQGSLVVQAAELVANSETTVMRPIYENPLVRELYETALSDLQNGLIDVATAAQRVYDAVQGIINSELGL